MKEQDEVDYRDVELRMFQHVLADDMPPEQEQEIAALVGEKTNSISEPIDYDKEPTREDVHVDQNQVGPSVLTKIRLDFEREREYQQRAHMYRLLKAGYTVKDNIFKEPAAEPVRPNPRNKKQEVLTQEQQRRLDRIKKTLKKRK